MAAEIEAQFEAFAATGLPLDHVNAHKHFHVHPVVAHLVLGIGARFGMRALRVPWERPQNLAVIEHDAPGRDWSVAPWAALLRVRAKAAGLMVPDAVIGLAWSGAMDTPRLAGALRQARGLAEIYCHPATAGGFDGAAPGYRYADELAALLSPEARDALGQSGARLGGYADFLG